jgi:hypothetical protein
MKRIGIYDSSLRLEETLIPSPNTVELVRSVESDYFLRFSNEGKNVAETFHLNSKMTPGSPLQLPCNREPLDEAREWFFTSSYDLALKEMVPEHADKVCATHDSFGPELGGLTAQLAGDGELSRLLHGLDVFIVRQRLVYRVVPRREYVWLERHLDDELVARLQSAFLPESDVGNLDDQVVIAVVGSFWRFMKFYGARGYRMILMDAGRLVHEIESRIPCTRYEVFYDDRVDNVLLLDGVEQSVLVLLTLKESGHV